MRKFFAALLGGLLLITAPQSARAAIKYVDCVLGSDQNNGTSGNPVATIAQGLLIAANGDTLKLAANTTPYDAFTLNGAIKGGTFGVTVIGDSAAPNKVIVPGAALDSYRQGRVYLTDVIFNGIRFTASVTAYQVGQYGNSVTGLHIRNCVLVQGYDIQNASVRVQACRVGTDSATCYARIHSISDQITAPKLLSNTFNLRTTDTASDYLFALYSEDAAGRPVVSPVMTNNKITVTLTQSIVKTTFLRGINALTSTDNKWTFNDSSGCGSCGQGYLMRDNLVSNSFLRDTIIVHQVRSGSTTLFAQLVGSGTVIPGHDNVWKYCYFKGDLPISSYGNFFVWQFQPRDSFVYNVVACSTSVAGGGFNVHNVAGQAIVDHNTFMNIGGGGAFRVDPTGDSNDDCSFFVGPLVISNNIFYTRSTGTGSSDYAARMNWRNTGVLFSNYNCYSHYGGSGARSLYGGPCGVTTLRSIGENSPICASNGWECASVYGSPRFADSTFANFNATIDSTGIAWGNGSGGSDIGAKPFAGPSVTQDVTAPGAISDLSYTVAQQDRVTLTWTSPGDDNSSGTATSYFIRYSTSTLTEDNFFSGNSPGNPPTPLAAGSTQTKLVTGLSSGQTYYFAIKAVDEVGNVGAISNVLSVTIPARGGTVSP